MPVIGLAGGIGSGKSAAAQLLADLGCVVSDSDAAARAALRDVKIKQRIVQEWGRDVLDQSGEIDRSKLAAIVFANPESRRKLEQITHPWIEARRLEVFAQAPPNAKALIIDAPLLFEAGLDKKCDAVIFVDAPVELRQKRVTESRGWDAVELAKREHSQLPLDEKHRRADYVVQNNGDLSNLKAQVGRILSSIVQSCQP